MNNTTKINWSSVLMICFILIATACSSPSNQEEKKEPERTTETDEKTESAPTPATPNYLAQVFESIEHISPTHEATTSKLLLPPTEWSILPQEIRDTIPEGGKVFILARGASLDVDRSIILEVELPGTSWPFYLQYLLALNDSYEVVMHHRLFSDAGEEQYNVKRHNIWKYGMGDMLSIAIDNGPWNYNVVYWELLTVQNNRIQLLESKSQSFEDYDESVAYYELVRDSPVDQEELPTIKLSELKVENVTVQEVNQNVLEAYAASIPASEAISLVEKLGFEVSPAYSKFYKSDDSRMFIPVIPEGESFIPNYDVLFCMGESSYFFTNYDVEHPSLLISREYDEEVHRWGVYDEISNQEGTLTFAGQAEEDDELKLKQVSKLSVKMFKDTETNGWIIKIGNEYFAMKQTLVDKFGVNEGDLGCG